MKRTLILIPLLFAALLITAPAVEKHSYIGVGICSMCHRGQARHMVHEKWLATKHSQAFKALDRANGEDKNKECLQCHTTGFGAGGYAIGAPNAAKFEGVQCEACHGPGSGYKTMDIMKDKKLAMANGLKIPTAETCMKCHGPKNPRAEKFNYAEALKKIEHGYLNK